MAQEVYTLYVVSHVLILSLNALQEGSMGQVLFLQTMQICSTLVYAGCIWQGAFA